MQEIEEDLARQKYEKLWKQYGPYIIGFALVLVAITAGFTTYKNYKLETAQKATLGYIELLDAKPAKQEEMIEKFQAFGQEHGGKTQAVYARLHAAASAIKSGKVDDGIKLYEGVAADSSIEASYRQLADLMIVQTMLDTGDVAMLEARLAPLTKDDCIWKYTAKEFAGYLAIRTGDKEKAKAVFAELKDMKDAPASITARATDVHTWLSGEGKP